MRLDITLEQIFDVAERYERGHSNTKMGRVVGMLEYTVWNVNRVCRGNGEEGEGEGEG